MNLPEFSKIIADCRKKESTKIIHNASYEHARELFINLIGEARVRKEDVIVASGNLNPDFYGELVDITKEAIKGGVQVRVAILNPTTDVKDNPFSAMILKEGGVVYKAKNEIRIPHFILVGDKRFRLEVDHEQSKAIACFNNRGIGEFLKNVFEKIVSSNLVERQQLPTA